MLGSSLLGAAPGEEPGWRGFALPRLLQKYSLLTASLILSALWSGFHLTVLFARGLMGLELSIYLLAYLVYNFSLFQGCQGGRIGLDFWALHLGDGQRWDARQQCKVSVW